MIMESLFCIGAVCKKEEHFAVCIAHFWESHKTESVYEKDNTICTFLGCFFYHNHT